MLLNTGTDANMQLTIKFLATFPAQDIFLDISTTAVKIPDISRFLTQIVALY